MAKKVFQIFHHVLQRYLVGTILLGPEMKKKKRFNIIHILFEPARQQKIKVDSHLNTDESLAYRPTIKNYD